MKTAKLVVAGDIIVPHVLVADRTWSRMRGLLGRVGLPEGTGMLLSPCNSIHTVGMRFSLDVVFLDRECRVVKVVRGLRPNRFTVGGRGARAAVELEAGGVDLSRLEVGVRVQLA
jgi:uncharacterized membrane protein (UPF0127 family)